MNISEVKRNLERTVLYNGAEYILTGCIIRRGDSISRIATDLNRSKENVQSILNEAKASGRYNMHIQKHLNYVNYKSTLSDDYVDSGNAIMDGYK